MSWKCDACGNDNSDNNVIRCVCGAENIYHIEIKWLSVKSR